MVASAMRVTGGVWLIWLVSCLLSFAVLEGISIYNRFPNDTLTATVARTVPWYMALGLLAFAVIAAIGHWWRAYRDKSGMR
jgi:hypothetical protein